MASGSAAGVQWEEEAREELEGTLAQAARDAARVGVTVETHARFGSPAEVLCDIAAHLDADLIVVGNQGMQGGRRFLGSVPNTVSHHSPVQRAHRRHAVQAPPTSMTRVVALFRDPLRTFLVLAIVVGGFLRVRGAVLRRHRRARALLPLRTRSRPAVRAREDRRLRVQRRLPAERRRSARSRRYQAAYFEHLLSLFPNALNPGGAAARRRSRSRRSAPSNDETFVTFSTFGSPVPYLPQAASLFVGRASWARASGRC